MQFLLPRIRPACHCFQYMDPLKDEYPYFKAFATGYAKIIIIIKELGEPIVSVQKKYIISCEFTFSCVRRSKPSSSDSTDISYFSVRSSGDLCMSFRQNLVVVQYCPEMCYACILKS